MEDVDDIQSSELFAAWDHLFQRGGECKGPRHYACDMLLNAFELTHVTFYILVHAMQLNKSKIFSLTLTLIYLWVA